MTTAHVRDYYCMYIRNRRRIFLAGIGGAAVVVGAVTILAATARLCQLPASYGKQLYGADVGAIDVMDVDAVDITLLGTFQQLIAHSLAPTRCPVEAGDLQWPALPNGHYWPPCLARVHHYPPHAAGAGWTEVMRRVLTISPENTTPPAAWFYHARGSGIWIDLGATAVYAGHNDACIDLLNASWPQCTYTAVWTAAIARGLDSIQYTHHCDRNCGCDLGEIVMLNASGLTTCPVPMRAGPNASRPCACSESASAWVNCGAEWPDNCHPWAMQHLLIAAVVVTVTTIALWCRLLKIDQTRARYKILSTTAVPTDLNPP